MGYWDDKPINVASDTALIIEGGGMRCTYTAGVITAMMEAEIHFPHVYGVSAGASISGNYVMGDFDYMYGSFAGLGGQKETGGWDSWLAGKGYFNVENIYQPGIMPGGAGPFKFADFKANPTKMTIQTFERDTGRTIVFTKDRDFTTPARTMKCIQASSTMPIMMPSPEIDGVHYYDGGLGRDYGILLHQAMSDGYKKFFIVHSRPQGYRREPVKNEALYKAFFWKYPLVAKAIIGRTEPYNALLDEIAELNRQGVAHSVFAENITISSGTLDRAELDRNFEMGLAQGRRQVPEWKQWLGIE